MKTVLIAAAMLAGSAAYADTYRITFESNWNLTDHLAIPGPAHFSPVVAASHNSNYDLLPIGGFATRGLENVAELGDARGLNAEIDSARLAGSIGDTLNTVNLFIDTATTQTFDIEITPEHPFLSFASMIAPSPDWMVGVSNLALYTEEGGFSGDITKPIPLYAINAGTEEGDFGGNFSLRNRATSPIEPISLLMTGAGFEAPFAFITIENLSAPEPEPEPEVTEKTYRFKIVNNWNAADHLGNPGNAHFSPVVAASHSSAYDLLPLGGEATAGVEAVAEQGATRTMNREIAAANRAGAIGETINTRNMFINRGMTEQEFEITVTKDFPLVSFLSMIAPSPDWIIGISNLELYTAEGGFAPSSSEAIRLYALDAGTESGDFGGNFSLNNPPTSPRGAIERLFGRGFEKPFAFLSYEAL